MHIETYVSHFDICLKQKFLYSILVYGPELRETRNRKKHWIPILNPFLGERNKSADYRTFFSIQLIPRVQFRNINCIYKKIYKMATFKFLH